MSNERTEVRIDSRTLSLSNLDKVLYPAAGFTKAQIIDYYARVAPAMLPHVSQRCITLRRWPNGVDGASFFEKRCPSHRPNWLKIGRGPGDKGTGIDYCRLDEQASLVWTANLAALELHSPMARCDDIENPTMVVFDLDPGEPAGMTECCQVALRLRKVLSAIGLQAWAKTSGSKGLQVYVPLNSAHSHSDASTFALAVGQLLAKERPTEVLVEMDKKRRNGKIFIDWSQNTRHKTTIAPYSLRAKATPTVSTPITWEEAAAGADGEPVSFVADEVLDRVGLLGDLFAETATLQQQLPAP